MLKAVLPFNLRAALWGLVRRSTSSHPPSSWNQATLACNRTKSDVRSEIRWLCSWKTDRKRLESPTIGAYSKCFSILVFFQVPCVCFRRCSAVAWNKKALLGCIKHYKTRWIKGIRVDFKAMVLVLYPIKKDKKFEPRRKGWKPFFKFEQVWTDLFPKTIVMRINVWYILMYIYQPIYHP